MASSAVPGFFAPLALRNYNVDCPERQQSWVGRALAKSDIYSRDYQVARALSRYFNPDQMPIVRLVDGGITDNLGVRGSMMSPIMHYGNVTDMAGAFDQQRLKKVTRVLVIIANAQSYQEYDWSRQGREPGLIESLQSSFDASINIMNTETIGLAKRGFMDWQDRINARRARAGARPVKVHFAALTFDHIKDDEERRYFNAIPTRLSLPGDKVDAVKGLARRLLRNSPEYQSFLGQYSHP